MRRALEQEDPIKDLTAVQLDIDKVIDRAMQENAWPFEGLAPDLDGQVQRELDRICGQFEGNWAPPPPLGVRKAAPKGERDDDVE
jgi:hypothetical protein